MLTIQDPVCFRFEDCRQPKRRFGCDWNTCRRIRIAEPSTGTRLLPWSRLATCRERCPFRFLRHLERGAHNCARCPVCRRARGAVCNREAQQARDGEQDDRPTTKTSGKGASCEVARGLMSFRLFCSGGMFPEISLVIRGCHPRHSAFDHKNLDL